MSTVNEKLTRLKHLVELGTRTKAELDSLEAKIQDIVTQGGEPNTIEEIWLNGVKQTPDESKAVNLEIAHPEYSIEKAEDSGDYAAVYKLMKDGVQAGAAINIPKDLVVKSGSVVGDEIVLVLNDEAATEIKIPVASLIEYVTSGSQTGDMVVVAVSEDHKVTATITDGSITLGKLAADVQTAIGKAHEHANKTVLDGIDASKVAGWDAAEQNAKTYADGLNTAMDLRVKDVENQAHEHANAEELDKIATGDKAKWDQAATDVETIKADYLKGSDKTELEGEIAAAQTAAEQKATDLNSAMDTRVKVLEAIDHEAYKAYADQAEADALAAAKTYADGLAGNYDAAGSAAQALADAKAYVDGQVASDAEVTTALDAIFGTTEA